MTKPPHEEAARSLEEGREENNRKVGSKLLADQIK